jgi:hypothetical protein
MGSMPGSGRIDRLFDEFDAALERFLALPFGSLTARELERHEFLMGRLDSLGYELTSPFVRPGRRVIDGAGHGHDLDEP